MSADQITINLTSTQSSANNFIKEVREKVSNGFNVVVVFSEEPAMDWLKTAQELAISARVDISFESTQGQKFQLLENDDDELYLRSLVRD